MSIAHSTTAPRWFRVLLIASAIVPAGCGDKPARMSPDTSAKAAHALAAARAAGTTGYHLGDEYDGLKLMGLEDQGGQVGVVALYGRCRISGGDEPGCPPPVQVQTHSLPPAEVPWTGCSRRTPVRGVTAVDNGGHLTLFPGDHAVEIITDGTRQPESVATALVHITGSISAQDNLPATSAATLALLDRNCASPTSPGTGH